LSDQLRVELVEGMESVGGIVGGWIVKGDWGLGFELAVGVHSRPRRKSGCVKLDPDFQRVHRVEDVEPTSLRQDLYTSERAMARPSSSRAAALEVTVVE
jgi:hypothetical protein